MLNRMTYLRPNNNIEDLVLSLIKDFKIKIRDKNIHKNVLDPFSSIIEASIDQLDYDNWITAERLRQNQKTLQNAIGDLHQKLLANIQDVEDLGVGEIVDIVCHKKKIIAEIKNKYNTTKGNHKKDIYDDISTLLNEPKYEGYTGYYVEIIPKNPIQFNDEFTPPDNTTNKNRVARKDIRKIDGKSFYEILTGDKESIYKMYDMISTILAKKCKLKTTEKFIKLLYKAYGER